MKTLLRNTAIYALTLYLLPSFLSGIQISGGFIILLISGLVLTLMLFILKPVINIISIPLNLATLGLFSLLTNLLFLYLLTVFVPNVTVTPFTFLGLHIAGFVIPRVHLGLFTAYVVIGIALSVLSGFFRWIVV